MLGSRFGDLEFRGQGLGFRVSSFEFRVSGFTCGVQGSGFYLGRRRHRVGSVHSLEILQKDIGFRVLGLGIRVGGWGLRVWG